MSDEPNTEQEIARAIKDLARQKLDLVDTAEFLAKKY